LACPGCISGVKFCAIIDLALSTGLRVSEISDIRIGGLTLCGPEPQVIMRNGRGGKSRTVTLPQDLRKHLRGLMRRKKRGVEPTRPVDYLFMTERGAGFTTPGVQLLFKRAPRKPGSPSHFSIHSCRYSNKTYLYRRTNDLKLVQIQVGH